ncbi:MAG: heme lyase CcmF/NrfE family subunit [Acidimicrobiales bacterium]
MNAVLGQIGVALGLVSAAGGMAGLGLGLLLQRDSLLRAAPKAIFGVVIGVLLATFAMEHALLTHDFSLSYVANNNSRQTPLLYDITGMWSALQGSILLWALVLTGYLALMQRRFRTRATDRLVAWATLVGLGATTFFFGLMAGPANPFLTIAGGAPRNGLGPNPLLQDNVLIAFHPVFLYLGYVGFTIPFAFAIAALVTGRLGEGWLVETRRWTVVAWAFLTVGIVMGAWWSYQVLGWGGFWAWDPVENAALLPWLCATAYLHSVMVQERRGLLRVWNISLLVATYALTILGTFLTRSGVIQSVHSFSDSGLGPVLIAYFGLVVALGVGLIGWRGDRLRSPGSIDSPISREGAFLVNNLLFGAFALVVLIGTVFPLFVEAISHQQITVGAPYYDSVTVPIGFALLFFMAVAPVLPWRVASSSLLRSRLAIPAWIGVGVVSACVIGGVRGLAPLAAFGLAGVAGGSALRQLTLATLAAHRSRAGAWRGLVGRANGGMIVHLGIVIVACGLAGATSFGHRGSLVLRPGERATFGGHSIVFDSARHFTAPNRNGVIALITVDGALLRPAISNFPGQEGIGTPGIDSSFFHGDVYVTIDSAPPNGKGPIDFGFVDQPLVMWLWIGGFLTGLGALLAAVPGKRRRGTEPVSAPVTGARRYRYGPPSRPQPQGEVLTPVPDAAEPSGAGLPIGSPR